MFHIQNKIEQIQTQHRQISIVQKSNLPNSPIFINKINNQFTRNMKVIQYLVFLIIAFTTLFTHVIAKGPNPYKVLGVSKDATQQQIKEGFKKRSRKYHPDRNKEDPRAKEKFEKIVNAYQLLKDPQRRRMYDMTGDDNPQGMPGAGGFPGGGGFHGFPGGGINIEDLMRGFGMGGGFGGGHPGFGGGGRFQGQQQGGQRRQQGGQRTYTFSFGGGGMPGGMRFQF